MCNKRLTWICGLTKLFFIIRLRRPIGKLTVTEQQFEGEYRYVNSRLITNSEEIAFYNGILKRFEYLLSMRKTFLQNTFVQAEIFICENAMVIWLYENSMAMRDFLLLGNADTSSVNEFVCFVWSALHMSVKSQLCSVSMSSVAMEGCLNSSNLLPQRHHSLNIRYRQPAREADRGRHVRAIVSSPAEVYPVPLQHGHHRWHHSQMWVRHPQRWWPPHHLRKWVSCDFARTRLPTPDPVVNLVAQTVRRCLWERHENVYFYMKSRLVTLMCKYIAELVPALLFKFVPLPWQRCEEAFKQMFWVIFTRLDEIVNDCSLYEFRCWLFSGLVSKCNIFLHRYRNDVRIPYCQSTLHGSHLPEVYERFAFWACWGVTQHLVLFIYFVGRYCVVSKHGYFWGDYRLKVISYVSKD